MNFRSIEAVANAVLFEGYMLYPYRPSALKNRQRWNFGTLYPHAFAERQSPPERWRFASEILIEAAESAKLTACVRFLQLVAPAEGSGGQGGWQQGFVRSRRIENISVEEWSDGVERSFDCSALLPEEIQHAPTAFTERARVGRLTLSTEHVRAGLYRLHAEFANESPVGDAAPSRTDVQDAAFVSAHLLLGLEEGAFVSLLEPPEEFETDAKVCVQDGVFPVLAGDPGDRASVLVSPIILYDYPRVASESPGDFFDGTEIDELLSLRVQTLTDREKAEMRGGDPFGRALLERVEALPNEQFMKMHGAVRGISQADKTGSFEKPQTAMDSWDALVGAPAVESVQVFGVEIRKGDRVRLWPQKKADIMDMAMEGKIALIEAIEQDLEGNIHFAVVLEDDPGSDLGLLRQIGHRFFFSPEEVEPLQMEVP